MSRWCWRQSSTEIALWDAQAQQHCNKQPQLLPGTPKTEFQRVDLDATNHEGAECQRESHHVHMLLSGRNPHAD